MPDADDVELAHRLADLADEISDGFARGHVRHGWKHDGSPVTEADYAVEAALLEVLAAERPDDAVLSEEHGTRGRSHRRWILDPIDGTYAFLEGYRSWGTHIALEDEGEITVAIITRPTEGYRWHAAKGGGAFRSDRPEVPLRVSTTEQLRGARLAGFLPPYARAVDAIEHAGGRWVNEALSPVGALIEGRIDAVFGPSGQTWDHAPEVLLVEEAGGTYRDPRGGRRIDLGGAMTTNGRIEAELLEVVAPYW